MSFLFKHHSTAATSNNDCVCAFFVFYFIFNEMTLVPLYIYRAQKYERFSNEMNNLYCVVYCVVYISMSIDILLLFVLVYMVRWNNRIISSLRFFHYKQICLNCFIVLKMGHMGWTIENELNVLFIHFFLFHFLFHSCFNKKVQKRHTSTWN